MILIEKETPHMFIWFSDGSKIPAGISPLPQNKKLAYIKRLKEESAKLLITKTPVYLIYMGRLLNAEQKILLESLQNEVPNLAVIDYDDVEKNIFDQHIIDKVNRLQSDYKKQKRLATGNGGIADLVDFTRLVLLYNSQILRAIAQTKITIPLEWREGLIYRDFDVTLEREAMTDIPTSLGCMATLNLSQIAQQHHTHLIESAQTTEDSTRIDTFFNKYIYNFECYQTILTLFSNRSLDADEQRLKQTIMSAFATICHKEFETIFIALIFLENSFLAFNQDQCPLIDKMIKQVLNGESPYAAVQANFRQKLNQDFKSREMRIHKTDLLKEFLTPHLFGFKIGNDLTWQMTVAEQHPQTVMLSPSSSANTTMSIRFTPVIGELTKDSDNALNVNALDVQETDHHDAQRLGI